MIVISELANDVFVTLSFLSTSKFSKDSFPGGAYSRAFRTKFVSLSSLSGTVYQYC